MKKPAMTSSGMPNILTDLCVRNADAHITVRLPDIVYLNALNAAIRNTCLPEQSFKTTSFLFTNCFLDCFSSLQPTKESVLWKCVRILTSTTRRQVCYAGNAGFSFLALFNLAFIAAFFAAVALKSGHIYTVCAMHTMWNFCQGNVFGLEVSGNAGNASLLHSTANSSAKDILTGGGFGPEGGLCVTIVIAAAFAIFFLIPRISRRKV
jgi:hypothetical protein